MKKLAIFFTFLLSNFTAINLKSQYAMRIASGAHIMVNPSRSITFGNSSGTPNNGAWSIEHFDNGLNFWKAWPTAGNGDYKMFIADWGCVGINCTPNKYNSVNPNWDRLHVNGKIVSRGHFTWSDERTKCQISNLSPALSKILSLRTVSYYDRANITIGDYESEPATNSDSSKRPLILDPEYCDTLKHFGLIAQEVKGILPNIVSETRSGVLALNYIEIVPLLIKSTQEQQVIIDTLNLKIQQLRQEIVNWKGRSIDTAGQSQTRLFQNTPNPFDGTTNISYFIDENTIISLASIEVRDIMGNLKNTITLGDRSGIGQVDYDGSQLTQGYYIYTLKINGSVKDSKMFLKEQ